MNKNSKKMEYYGGAVVSLLPFLFFFVTVIYISVSKSATERGMWAGAVIGILITFFFAKDKIRYGEIIIEGMADKMTIVPIVCWIFAGIFGGVLRSSGLVEGIIWAAYSVGAKGKLYVFITFIASAVFATAAGTGMGTAVAGMSVLYPAGVFLGANPYALAGAIIGGGAFGDNLAPISDTTICSATSQGADVPGVVKSRVQYSVVAAIITIVAIFIFAGNAGSAVDIPQEVIEGYFNPKGLIMLIPAALTIYVAIKKGDIIYATTIGTVIGIIIALIFGLITFSDVFFIKDGSAGGILIDGIAGMADVIILTLLIMAMVNIMKVGEGDKLLLDSTSKFIKTARGAEGSIAVLEIVISSMTGVNTPAILAVGAPFAKPIGEKFKIHPYRRANILDATSVTLNYIFPWTSIILMSSALSRQASEQFGSIVPYISPEQFFPWIFYSWALLAVMIFAIVTGWGRTYIGENGEPVKELPKQKKEVEINNY